MYCHHHHLHHHSTITNTWDDGHRVVDSRHICVLSPPVCPFFVFHFRSTNLQLDCIYEMRNNNNKGTTTITTTNTNDLDKRHNGGMNGHPSMFFPFF